MTEIKMLSKCEDSPFLRIGRLNTVKESVLPNLIYRFNVILVKISVSYFVGINKLIPKFIKSLFKLINTILKEKNKVRRLTETNSKTYYKTTIIKIV